MLLMISVGPLAGAVPQNRKEHKAMEAARDSVRAAVALEAVKNMDFVVEAERLVLPSGENIMVTSNVNFVSVNGEKAVIQVAPLSGPGHNGVGGITVDGYISDVDFNTDKRGNLNVTMNVTGAAVSCRLSLSLPKGGVNARIRVDPNYSSDDITLVGSVVPTELSSVHQGMTL